MDTDSLFGHFIHRLYFSSRNRHIIGHTTSEGPIHSIYIWLRVRCHRSNVSTTIAHNEEYANLCHQIIESLKTYVFCLQVHGCDSISKMLNSSALVTSVMILDQIFRSVRHSDRK